MSFGRLEIFKPDEPIENFVLEKDVIAIGRSTGNDLVLDRTGVSRYHVNLSITDDNQALLTDLESVNRTYVDGMIIEANSPRLLRGGEEIQIGDVRLVYHPESDIATALETETQRIELPAFLLSLEAPRIAVAPGAHARAFLTIENFNKDQVETFHVKVSNVPREWVRIDRSEVDVPPDTSVRLGITFKPLRRSDTAPGDYTPVVSVYSESNPDDVVEIKTRLVILAYGGYGMVMGTPLIEGNQNFQLYVQNQGNAPLTVSFNGTSKTVSLVFKFQEPTITLSPGERRTVSGTIQPTRQVYFGKPADHTYDILTRSHDVSRFLAAVSGKYRIRPALPAWAPGVGLIGGVAVIGLFILLIFMVFGGNGDDNQPAATTGASSDQAQLLEPEIVSFQLSQNTIAFGEPLYASWEVLDAETVNLRLEHQNQQVAGYPLLEPVKENHDVFPPHAGIYTVVLSVETEDGVIQDSREQQVSVEPDVTLNVTVPDGRIYRHVEHEIMIDWEVNWSDESAVVEIESPQVRLTGELLGYDGSNQQPLSWNDVVTLSAADALSPLSLILTSTGPDGITVTRQESFDLVYPTCSLSQSSDNQFFSAPSFNAASVEDVSLDAERVNVDARDESGEWLRIQYSVETGEQFAWIQWADIQPDSCDFDPERLLTMVADVPEITSYVLLTSNGGDLAPGFYDALRNIGENYAGTNQAWNSDTLLANQSVLVELDVIVVYNLSSVELLLEERETFREQLATWVDNGGHLIVHGGQNSRETLDILDTLLPVQVNQLVSIQTLNPVGAYLEMPDTTLNQTVLISDSSPRANAIILVQSATRSYPLIVREVRGQGVIDFIAFSPVERAFRQYDSRQLLWPALLADITGIDGG